MLELYAKLKGHNRSMWCDLKLAARLLARDRTFTFAVVALLSFSIGANTALFGLVDALLLRPLPVRDPSQLVHFVTIQPPLPPRSEFLYEEYETWNKKLKGLTDIFAWSERDSFVRYGKWIERLRIQRVSPNFFESLGTTPALGRLLNSTDHLQQVAVIAYPTWQRRFRGDPSILGQPIAIEGQPFTIVGVSQKGFNGLQVETGPELHIPMNASSRSSDDCSVVGRLRPGVSMESARTEADAIRVSIGRQLAAKGIDGSMGAFQLEPASRGVSRMRSQFSAVLSILMGGFLLLLLMVCANVAALLMARIASRRSELAVRVALGASRVSIFRHLVAEGLLLMLAGSVGAFAVAAMLIPQLAAVLPPVRDLTASRLPLTLDIALDWRIFGFSIAVSALALLLIGLAPALAAIRRDLHSLLKESRAGGAWRGRQLLVVTQIALATLLLAAAGLTLLTIQRLGKMDGGFIRDGVLTFSIDSSMASYNEAQDRQLRLRLLAEAQSLPGTLSAAFAGRALMRGTGVKITAARTGESAPQSEFLNSSANAVSPEYFATLGIPLLAGSLFKESVEIKQPEARIVNQAFVRKFFPNLNPIGQTFGIVAIGKETAKPRFQIVGVVGNTRYRSLREPVQPIVYGPLSLGEPAILHLRSRAPNSTVIAAMQSALTRIDPRISFIEVNTLSDEVDASLWAERVAAFVANAMAIAATLIAAAGIYSLLAFAVQQRRREIGIRVALGAQWTSIAWLFGGRALLLAACGIGIGLTFAWLGGPVIQALLYEVEPFHKGVMASAITLVLLFALLAALVPSMQAARTDPSKVLSEI